MALQYRIRDGRGELAAIQVGIQDVLATVSAAHSAWGWFGGLNGVRHILDVAKFPSSRFQNLFTTRTPQPASCEMLTFQGVATLIDEDTEAFSGNPATHFVGVTICALAHELGGLLAVDIFMSHLYPYLFQGDLRIPGVREALLAQLKDKVPTILNEGASRGLPQMFADSVVDANLSNGNYRARHKTKWEQDPSFVNGFVRWIGRRDSRTYFTRSAIVARIACYLRSVGFDIAMVRTWDGRGTRPAHRRSVVLVVGGFHDTDEEADEDAKEYISRWIAWQPIAHYRFSTTGAMLLDTLRQGCNLRPETAQQWFESIQVDLSNRLTFKWASASWNDVEESDRGDEDVFAVPYWRSRQPRSTPMAIRLGSIFFPKAAELVAKYYEPLAQQRILDRILKQHYEIASDEEHAPNWDNGIVQFKAITASICIAVISIIGGPGYETLRHATTISLTQQTELGWTCSNVSELLSSRLSISQVAICIAHIHCGGKSPSPGLRPNEEESFTLSRLVGWRNANYAVLPALLFTLSDGPSNSNLGFRCIDRFVGNLSVYPDGAVKTNNYIPVLGPQRDPSFFDKLMSRSHSDALESQIMHSESVRISIGVPQLRPPDKSIYVNIERPPQFSGPDIAICGRVDGEVVDTFGVLEILLGIIKSIPAWRDTAASCSTHSGVAGDLKVLNVAPSSWAAQRSTKRPVASDARIPTYIQVQDDPAWALFLAGEPDAIICKGCIHCAVETEIEQHRKFRIIIGYS